MTAIIIISNLHTLPPSFSRNPIRICYLYEMKLCGCFEFKPITEVVYLSRGLSSLKTHHVQIVFICHGNSTKASLLSLDLLVTHIRREQYVRLQCIMTC